ncbi:hypothetical protein CONPUDRAFT_73198 [Coniophora puteana RWD-64-598 SS2]|uniref:Uncharacterized protein n=1 Tax=Coniophora puteana (strain RWD-64-598) TaxID=741705 RepID=A0A5M3MQZ1_CONPW|nr:uncharacterized protein CONPUDRAFT_73198 [Coniophora puteana RWD-64-598 SS2]EIW81476.1 hypothetical protein CONPUDRAFT_73198 [Coniophora puteana RWD-64-598 SS2]
MFSLSPVENKRQRKTSRRWEIRDMARPAYSALCVPKDTKRISKIQPHSDSSLSREHALAMTGPSALYQNGKRPLKALALLTSQTSNDTADLKLQASRLGPFPAVGRSNDARDAPWGAPPRGTHSAEYNVVYDRVEEQPDALGLSNRQPVGAPRVVNTGKTILRYYDPEHESATQEEIIATMAFGEIQCVALYPAGEGPATFWAVSGLAYATPALIYDVCNLLGKAGVVVHNSINTYDDTRCPQGPAGIHHVGMITSRPSCVAKRVPTPLPTSAMSRDRDWFQRLKSDTGMGEIRTPIIYEARIQRSLAVGTLYGLPRYGPADFITLTQYC